MAPTTDRKKETEQRIIEAAIALMSRKGFHRVSVQEVGEKAGLCEKTVFRYFPTKKDLLDGIIRYRSYAGRMKEQFERQRTWDLAHDLDLAARLYVRVTREKRDAFRSYLSALDSIDTNGEAFMHNAHALLDFISEYMAEMQRRGLMRRGDARLLARTFINTLHGFMLMYCLNDDPVVWEQRVESMKLAVGLFIQGFSPVKGEEAGS